MGSYNRAGSYEAYSPKVVNDTFNNTDTALVATEIVPSNPSSENLPALQPEPNHEEKRAQGDSLNVGEIYDLGFSDGSGTKRAACIFGLHIKDSFMKLAYTDITGGSAEVFTVLCVADVAGSLNNKYFCFEVIDATLPKVIIRYYVWFNVNGAGVDPSITGRTAIPIALATGATAPTVATAVQGAIDALDDASATVLTSTVTVTLGTTGAVDNAWDYNTGFTITTTTDGYSTKVITESITLPNAGYHNEKELSSEDIRFDVVGLTQIGYTWQCESGGILEEEREYISAKYLAGSDLARPRCPDGTEWTSAQHPFEKYKKNFHWGSFKDNITFQYNSVDVECEITSIKIKVALDVDYKRDGGDSYSNNREIKARDYEITMTVRPSGTDLRTISNLHYKDYAGDLTLTAKAQRESDTHDYIQWEFTKLRLLPIPQDIIVEPYYEEIDIVMHAAPANVTTITICDYLSQKYYGVA